MTDEERASARQAFVRTVAAAGSQSAFERCVGAKQQKVSYWLRRGMVLPGEYVLQAERVFGVSRHELRPDLYPLEVSVYDRTVEHGLPIASCDRSGILHAEKHHA
jgi:DNA-binding transcriptional regulator YdaS (Cro superfamily)